MDWLTLIDVAESLATILALFVGGAWTYLRFIRGRTIQPKLSLQVGGESESMPSRQGVYLRIAANISNKGSNVVQIEHSHTGIALYGETGMGISPMWQDLAAIDAFCDSDMIEPNQDISEEQVIRLPCVPSVALKLELHLQTKAKLFGIGRASQWTTSSIILPKPNLGNHPDGTSKHHSDQASAIDNLRTQEKVRASEEH